MAEYMHSDFYIVNWSQSLYVEFIVKSFICLSQMKKPSNSFPPNPEKKILTLPCSPHPQSMRQGASLAQIKMSSSASVSTRENRGTPEQQCEQWEGWWCQQSQGEEEPECVCVSMYFLLSWRYLSTVLFTITPRQLSNSNPEPHNTRVDTCAQGQGKFICTAQFRQKASQNALQGHTDYIKMN